MESKGFSRLQQCKCNCRPEEDGCDCNQKRKKDHSVLNPRYMESKGFSRLQQCKCNCRPEEDGCDCNQKRKKDLELSCCGKWPEKKMYDSKAAECIKDKVTYGQSRMMIEEEDQEMSSQSSMGMGGFSMGHSWMNNLLFRG